MKIVGILVAALFLFAGLAQAEEKTLNRASDIQLVNVLPGDDASIIFGGTFKQKQPEFFSPRPEKK